MKARKYKIKVEVYESTVYLVLSEDCTKSFNSYAKKYKWDPEEEDNQGYFIKDNVQEYYMFLPFDAKLGTIAHEVLHATFDILQDHGVTLSPESEESFTYLHDYLIQKVQDKL